MGKEGRQGFLVAPRGRAEVGRVACRLQCQAVLAGQPRTRVPVISSSRGSDMEWFGRNLVGSIKRAAAPPGGGDHDKRRARTKLRPCRVSARLGQAADLPVAQAVVDEGEELAGGRHPPDVRAAALADAVVVRGDGRGPALADDAFDRCPAHES